MPSTTSLEIASGGVFWVVGNQTVASLADLGSSGGKVMCSSASTATLTLAPPAGTTTFSGVVQNYSATSGTLALVIGGTGTEVLAGSNTYSGGTTIQSGTLQLGDGVSKNGSVAGNITDNARLTFANPNAETYSGTISGSGSLTKTAAGALILAGSNLYSGGTEIDAGTLVAANGTNGSATGSGGVTLKGGILASAIGGGSIARRRDRQLRRFRNRPRRGRLHRPLDHRQLDDRLEPDHAQFRLDHSGRQRRSAGDHGRAHASRRTRPSRSARTRRRLATIA